MDDEGNGVGFATALAQWRASTTAQRLYGYGAPLDGQTLCAKSDSTPRCECLGARAGSGSVGARGVGVWGLERPPFQAFLFFEYL